MSGVSTIGLVTAGGLGAALGQMIRVVARETRRPGRNLGRQLAGVAADLLRAVGLGAMVLAAYWLTVLAGLIGVMFVIASLVCLNGQPLNGGGAPNGALALALLAAAVGCAYLCVVQLGRVHRRVRAAIDADIDLGVPLLGPGRLWVASTAITAAGVYAVVTQGGG